MTAKTELIPAGNLSLEIGWDLKADRLVLGFYKGPNTEPLTVFGLDRETALELAAAILGQLRRREDGDG